MCCCKQPRLKVSTLYFLEFSKIFCRFFSFSLSQVENAISLDKLKKISAARQQQQQQQLPLYVYTYTCVYTHVCACTGVCVYIRQMAAMLCRRRLPFWPLSHSLRLFLFADAHTSRRSPATPPDSAPDQARMLRARVENRRRLGDQRRLAKTAGKKALYNGNNSSNKNKRKCEKNAGSIREALPLPLPVPLPLTLPLCHLANIICSARLDSTRIASTRLGVRCFFWVARIAAADWKLRLWGGATERTVATRRGLFPQHECVRARVCVFWGFLY